MKRSKSIGEITPTSLPSETKLSMGERRLTRCRMIEEDKQKQLAEMKGTLWGMISGGPAGAQPALGQDQAGAQAASK